MSYVKDTDIFDATDGGLDVIKAYYPNCLDVFEKRAKQFKIRGTEKTASASLKKLDNGVWVVTDFGGDQVSRNCIQVCALEESVSYGEACALLGSRYNVKGAELQVYKPIIERRPLTEKEIPNTYHFTYKEFSEKELALLGPRVNKIHCESFNLKSCKSYAYCRENETIVTEATEDYPIFVFDFGSWQKIYQPNSFDKQYRFRYAGEKPKRYIFGMELLEKEFQMKKKAQEETWSIDDETDDDDDDKPSKKFDPRVDGAFIISGGTDGLNLYSFGKFPIFTNSETDQLDFNEIKKIKVWAKDIYYVADLDATGIRQALAMGLKFLDIKLFWLPEKLKQFRDKRGNPCKDFKDYVEKYYDPKNSVAFANGLDKLISNSLPLQFWTEWFSNRKMNYNLSNTRLYHFLKLMGFGRYESENLKEGFIYIRKEGSIVKVLHPYEIENFVHSFLEERQMNPDLRDYIYNSPRLRETSLSKLPRLEIDFTDADRNFQYLFFTKSVWKITPDEIKEFKQGEVDRFVWEDKVIDHKVKKEDPHFEISTDSDGDLDIKILKKDNPFLNYLINTSRVHWRKELEDFFENKPEKLAEKYFKENQFNIEGENLNADEIYEQKLHLINKIYSIGYLLHKHKDESKAWCVFAMDNKISDTGESHGGSGKSLCYGYLNNVLKRRFYLKGRDEKLTQNDFIYHGVTDDTDYIMIDDASQYIKFDFFFSEITGSLKVNPKNGQPYEIPFSKAPKFVISSNFTIRDADPSTERRLLYTVFSDYYHFNKEEEYKQVRQVSDDFEGRNLFKDFTEEEWNAYYNFCAQCIQFFLKHPRKINPPMDNVTKRSLQSEMGDAFIGWADAFFATKETNPVTFEEESFKYLDQYFSKDHAFDEFMKATKMNKWTPNKFKKSLKAFCKLNGYIFNPKDLHNATGRIIQRLEGKSQEVIYIRTVEIPKAFKTSDIQVYKNEEDIFKE